METRILIVDDQQASAGLIADTLAGLGKIHHVVSAAQALLALNDYHPDIVILSAKPVGLESCQLCRQMRKACNDVRILFLEPEAEHDDQHRMEAYIAGADDYLSHPYSIEELQRKVELLQVIIHDASRLKESVSEANAAALQAISSTGEMGGVIDFMKRTMNCAETETLLKALLSTLSSRFQLKAAAQIRDGEEQKTLNTEGRSSPLEADMLNNLAQDERRIYQYGHRLVLNYPCVILQVKDMPEHDPALCGRLRDHLAIMVEAADHRVNGIALENRIRRQGRSIQNTLGHLRDVLGLLEQKYKHQQSSTLELFNNLRNQLDMMIGGLGLTDRQEAAIVALIAQSAQDADSMYEAGLMLDKHFDGILEELSEIVSVDIPDPVVTEHSTEIDDNSILLF